jgi:hypothetical protein
MPASLAPGGNPPWDRLPGHVESLLCTARPTTTVMVTRTTTMAANKIQSRRPMLRDCRFSGTWTSRHLVLLLGDGIDLSIRSAASLRVLPL